MTYDEALDKLAATEARQGVLHQALAEVRQLLWERGQGFKRRNDRRRKLQMI
jgi:hypothetical protein